MWDDMHERAVRCAEYMIETGCTVRACAAHFGMSKSTVHKDVTERLFFLEPALWRRVQKVLKVNLSERHLRGGNATRLKYLKRTEQKNKCLESENLQESSPKSRMPRK